MKKMPSNLQEDMAFGQLMMIVSTPDADMKQNIDYTIGTLGIAYRHRRIKINKYREISIRNSRSSGAKTERQKILDGECQSRLFIFEFLDAYAVCRLVDILDCLRENRGYVQPNHDGKTSAYYIKLDDIKHLIIWR